MVFIFEGINRPILRSYIKVYIRTMELATVKKMRIRLEKLSVENYRMAAEIQALEQTILELKNETISKKELQQEIYDMDEEDNIWDILCDEYGFEVGKGEDTCDVCDRSECDCVFCCVCGEVNMTKLTDNMRDTCDECRGSECEDDVCCVGCGEKVCEYNEEPPHKDSRDEAVCEDCWSVCGP